MEIVIYWDSLFLLNFIMNYWILRVLSYKYALGTKRICLVLAALFGAGVYGVFLVAGIGTKYGQLLEVLISIPILVAIILPKKGRRLFWKVTCSGLFCSFLVAGILRTIFAKRRLFFRGSVHIFSVITVGYIVIEGILVYLYRKRQRKRKRLFAVTLCAGEARACITALLDTGNSLIEPISKKPVCLLESGVLERLVDKEAALMRAVPYCSVGCEKGILYAVEIPKMQIACDGKVKEVQDVFCAEVPHKLATNDTYKMILHPECVGEI